MPKNGALIRVDEYAIAFLYGSLWLRRLDINVFKWNNIVIICYYAGNTNIVFFSLFCSFPQFKRFNSGSLVRSRWISVITYWILRLNQGPSPHSMEQACFKSFIPFWTVWCVLWAQYNMLIHHLPMFVVPQEIIKQSPWTFTVIRNFILPAFIFQLNKVTYLVTLLPTLADHLKCLTRKH